MNAHEMRLEPISRNPEYIKQKIKVPLALERPNPASVFISVKNNFKAQD
jgi:hypothetical protein